MTANEREIGALLEAVRGLREDIARLERERQEEKKGRDAFKADVDAFKSDIKLMLAEIKGGSKVVRFMGLVTASIIGGLVATVKAWGPVFLSMLPR